MAQASIDTLEIVDSKPVRLAVGAGLASSLDMLLHPLGVDKAFLVVDRGLPSGLAKKVVEGLSRLATGVKTGGGEKSKTVEWVLSLLEDMAESRLTRSSAVVAVGGGALLDAAGLAASLYMRGVRLVNVPTTSLAMFDASVGGKTGVNFSGGKNMVGSFYHPDLVVADVSLLASLPESIMSEGLAELVKHALLSGREAVAMVERLMPGILSRREDALASAVRWSLGFKLGVISKDFRESRGVRTILNLGHTVAHAIEACTSFRVSHGRAVSVGLVWEAMVGERLFGTSGSVKAEAARLLSAAGLPISLSQLGVDPGSVVSCIRWDKKASGGTITLPLLDSIGLPRLYRARLDMLEQAMREVYP